MARTAHDTRTRAAAAITLADILEGIGVHSDQVDSVTDAEWSTAAWTARGMGKPVGPVTRNIKATVAYLLQKREQEAGDVFHLLPQAHGPR